VLSNKLQNIQNFPENKLKKLKPSKHLQLSGKHKNFKNTKTKF